MCVCVCVCVRETNTILYLPQVHWGYHQALFWSQLAMGLEKGISKMTPWGLSM